jgi:CBS domain-containing protein
MEADQNMSFILGLATAIGAGLLLAAISVWMRRREKGEIRASDLALALIPFFVWLLATGQINKLGFGGVEIEVRNAILNAVQEPVAGQVQPTSISGLVNRLETGERGAKGGVDRLPELRRRQIEALEFHLGRRGYYVGGIIARYLETLSPLPFFRYVVIFDEQGRLAGIFDQNRFVEAMSEQATGYDWFAGLLNRGGQAAVRELATLPGFVPGDAAVTPDASKRTALARMEEVDSSILPVVDHADRRLVGVLDRGRLTASLMLDITAELEAAR